MGPVEAGQIVGADAPAPQPPAIQVAQPAEGRVWRALSFLNDICGLGVKSAAAALVVWARWARSSLNSTVHDYKIVDLSANGFDNLWSRQSHITDQDNTLCWKSIYKVSQHLFPSSMTKRFVSGDISSSITETFNCTSLESIKRASCQENADACFQKFLKMLHPITKSDAVLYLNSPLLPARTVLSTGLLPAALLDTAFLCLGVEGTKATEAIRWSVGIATIAIGGAAVTEAACLYAGYRTIILVARYALSDINQPL